MNKTIQMALLALAFAGCALAETTPVAAAPEIDGATTASAIALVTGGLLLLRSRRK